MLFTFAFPKPPAGDCKIFRQGPSAPDEDPSNGPPGGGPVGLALALGLASHGVASVVIEADETFCYGSRAICIARRSLEIIERIGAAKGFKRKALPWTGGRSFYRDTEVLYFKMPHDENQKLPPMVNIAQYDIEQFLVDAVVFLARFVLFAIVRIEEPAAVRQIIAEAAETLAQ